MTTDPILKITPRGARLFLLGVLAPVLALSLLAGAFGTWYAADGISMGNARVTNLSTPSNDYDGATRNYTINVSKPRYMGVTSLSYSGDMGGLDGVNAKCDAQYPDSHMCTFSEILQSGRTTAPSNGWVSCDLASNVCYSMDFVNKGDSSYGGCIGWSYNATTGVSGYITSGGLLSAIACRNSPQPIHCCK